MSMNVVIVQPPEDRSKCTRGDKCILIHIAVTVVLILILMIVYSTHLYFVQHERNDMFKITRRSYKSNDTALDQRPLKHESIGIVYINADAPKRICNAILIKHRWSLVPAHCISIRSAPLTAEYLPHWKIRYQVVGQPTETDIKRGITHTHYNEDDFGNNIGLFEHLEHIYLPGLLVSYNVDSLLESSPDEIAVVGWYDIDEMMWNRVHLLESKRCTEFLSSIVDSPRASENCVMRNELNESQLIDHGAGLLVNSEIVGFFSWGERAGVGEPLVVLTIAPFKSWLEETMA